MKKKTIFFMRKLNINQPGGSNSHKTEILKIISTKKIVHVNNSHKRLSGEAADNQHFAVDNSVRQSIIEKNILKGDETRPHYELDCLFFP